MITFFTTTKGFNGLTKVNQLNAIHSWLNAPCPVEVIVMGKSEGVEEVVNGLQLTHITEIETSETGVPMINAMFDAASRTAKYPICCFLNADIILTHSFIKDIVAIHQEYTKKYLLVGQRWDVDVDYAIDFSSDWETPFFERHRRELVVHPPHGSDFFVFPKGQYSLDTIPNLLVGRPGWDLWMIYNARKNGWKVVDLSFSSKVIHQNHDYTHKIRDENKRKQEDEVNFQFLPPSDRDLYTLLACNYYYDNQKVKKNYARGDLYKYQHFEFRLHSTRKYYYQKVKLKVKLLKLINKTKGFLFPFK